ncbi:ROK family protein [Phycicoccus sp. BSK3Z-2]|uniref:ROK family protein n=1 Tax=Phycicoccus avicenniae TaxID=2828860 RepID=A0A941D5I6_9MICO|nr:ROK family transcriptional regulator [Phycicoccus avicenniae]MBR7741836.1 ROK family protein [Phycicoccus avicenniae]
MSHRSVGETSLAIRDVSAARCAVALRDHGHATVADVARRLGLSRPTVEAGLSAMVARAMVVETDGHTAGGRGVGRPARLFAFNNAAGYFIGVDIGIHRIRVAVADLAGGVVSWVDEQAPTGMSGPARLSMVKDLVHQALHSADVSVSDVVALAAAVSGMVNAEGRLIASVLLSEWEGVDVAGHLRAEFNCAVIVENDMRLAALAEHRFGAARLMDDVVFFFAGHRIAMGLLIDGELRRGHNSAAGEIGEMAFGTMLNASGDLTWRAAATGEEVFRQAAAGDAGSQAEVAEFVEGLAAGMALVTMAIDPDIVVIGGGLSGAGDVLLEPLRDSINAQIRVPVRPAIRGSELGTEAVVLGALALAGNEATDVRLGVRGLPAVSIDVAGARSSAQQGGRS